jgi:hypothetical protein
VLPVSMETLLSLQQLMWGHEEPAVRQLAFMLLQKLAGQPATLYRWVNCRAHSCCPLLPFCLFIGTCCCRKFWVQYNCYKQFSSKVTFCYTMPAGNVWKRRRSLSCQQQQHTPQQGSLLLGPRPPRALLPVAVLLPVAACALE